MKRACRGLLALIISSVMVLQPAAAIPVFAVQENACEEVTALQDELLVLTEKDASRREIKEIAEDAGADVEQIKSLSDGTKLVSIDTQDTDSAAAAASIQDEDKILIVQPNYKYRPDGKNVKKEYGINDTHSDRLWYLDKKGAPVYDRFGIYTTGINNGAVSASAAWGKLKKSDSSLSNNDKPLVAVIDSGVYLNHSDLKGCLQKSLCARINDGKTTIMSSNEDGDSDGHGTHVSGIIAADKNNNLGTAGIAGNRARLFCVDAMSEGEYEDFFTTQDICLSIDYAVSKGAKIINMSLGSLGRDYLLERGIEKAYSKGVLCICAAGNENTDCMEAPGDAPHAISVMSHDISGDGDNYSDYGVEKDVSAPGNNIYSLFRGRDSYISMSGTSMAAPMVTGLAALLLSEDMSLTPQQIKNLIFTSSGNNSYSEKRASSGNNGGFGCINAENAIDNLHQMQDLSNEPERVELNKSSVTMYEGETTYIEHEVLPGSAKNVEPQYYSSNSSVAAVSGGVITAKSPGSAQITVKCGDAQTNCLVTVKRIPYNKIDRKPYKCTGSFDAGDPQSHFVSDDKKDDFGTYMDQYKIDLVKGESIQICIEGSRGEKFYPILAVEDDTGKMVARSATYENTMSKIFFSYCKYTANKSGTFTVIASEGLSEKSLTGNGYTLKLGSDMAKTKPSVRKNNIGAVEVSWNATGDAEGYGVRKYSDAKLNNELGNWVCEGLSFTDTGYYEGETAYYTVTPLLNTEEGYILCGESAPVRFGSVNDSESRDGNHSGQVTSDGGESRKSSYGQQESDNDAPAVSLKAPAKLRTKVSLRNKTIKVSVSKVAGAEKYKVAYRKAGKRKWKNVSIGSKRTIVIRGIRKGQMLEIKAAGIPNSGVNQVTGKWSRVSRVYCKAAKVRISRKKRGLDIRFKRDKASTGYRVKYSPRKSFRKSKTITHNRSKKTLFRIRGLKKGRKYFIKYSPVRTYKGKVYQGVVRMTKARSK